ncbi:MAG: hypothetical protein RL153_623 [Verrucomicrobiota bacterium]|jgi:uncharacterized protein Yka (UPF0111/DUF47 family)
MFSLKKLIGGEEVFFELLEKSAEEARESVDILVRLLAKPEAGSLDDFALLRKKDKRITEEISERLTTTFVTPLEREDIEALSNALYKIPKTLEKFGERLLLCPERVRKVDFSRQAGLLLKAADVVLVMVRALRSSPDLEKVKEQNDRLQYLEGEADKLMVELLRNLYAGEKDAVSVIALKDLYDLLEKVIDRCRDAGNVIFHIVLKNS